MGYDIAGRRWRLFPLADLKLKCPACGENFTSKKLRQSPKRIRQASDFREVYADSAPWYEYQVHLCAMCPFAGSERLFEECREVGPNFGLAAVLDSELGWNQEFARRSAVERYYHAVHVAKLLDEEEKTIAQLALGGAWCALATEDRESEIYFRREAIEAFCNAMEEFDAVALDERAGIAYMIGEQWRRLGMTDTAHQWFRSVAAECALVDQKHQGQWSALAEGQMTNPKEWL